MIADWRLLIEVDAFFSGWSKAFKSKICILKSKITELHHSSRLPQRGKSIGAPSGGSPKPNPKDPASFIITVLSCRDHQLRVDYVR
jgi:hypothetical protein